MSCVMWKRKERRKKEEEEEGRIVIGMGGMAREGKRSVYRKGRNFMVRNAVKRRGETCVYGERKRKGRLELLCTGFGERRHAVVWGGEGSGEKPFLGVVELCQCWT